MGVQSRILPPHRRVVIEAEIETCLHRATLLIARLDRADAPFDDLEEEFDCAADDHPCDVGRDDLLPVLPAMVSINLADP